MLNSNFDAFGKIKDLVGVNLRQMKGINKVRGTFFTSLVETWLALPVRYTLLNLGRFSSYCEKSMRLHFQKSFDFASFNSSVINAHCSKTLIAAFDPSYVPKSGKHTPGLGKWWSGKDQCSLKGLEISSLAIVDTEARTAMSLEVVQTPSKEDLEKKGQNLVSHYVSVIKKQMSILKPMVKYLVADGYFMKHDFIQPLLDEGLHLITKMRPDANLRYPCIAVKRKTRGRPKVRGEKVDCGKIDSSHIIKFSQDEQAVYYSGILYCVTLEALVRIVYIQDIKSKRYDILLSTDTSLDPGLIVTYYRLRFQIEFLIRDAKQYAGLEECQARSENKLNFHFNMAFTVVSIAKAATWLALPVEKREAFSMRNLKVMYYNKFLTERIFANLDMDLNCQKIKSIYHQCLDIGALAA